MTNVFQAVVRCFNELFSYSTSLECFFQNRYKYHTNRDMLLNPILKKLRRTFSLPAESSQNQTVCLNPEKQPHAFFILSLNNTSFLSERFFFDPVKIHQVYPKCCKEHYNENQNKALNHRPLFFIKSTSEPGFQFTSMSSLCYP